MSPKTGIEKYQLAQRDPKKAKSSQKKSEEKGTLKAQSKSQEKYQEKAEEKVPSKPSPLAKAKLVNGKLAYGNNRKELAASGKVIDEAMQRKIASAAAGAAQIAIQRESAKGLKDEGDKASRLVKEELSPVSAPRERVVKEYAPLIKYIAQKIAARLPANIELDDLMSSGVIGLMDAIDKYDPSRDNKFKTYAEFRIRGAILDELRAQDWVPRSVREKAKILERAYSKLEQEKGRHATDEEICSELNVSQEEFHDLLNQVRSVSLLSFDDISNFSKADKRTLHGLSENAGSRAPNPLSEINVVSVKKLVSEAIQDLPEKQRLVLSLYYYEDLNLKEIGRVLDVTESRVSQLHTQAILKLKGRLKNHWDEVVGILA